MVYYLWVQSYSPDACKGKTPQSASLFTPPSLSFTSVPPSPPFTLMSFTFFFTDFLHFFQLSPIFLPSPASFIPPPHYFTPLAVDPPLFSFASPRASSSSFLVPLTTHLLQNTSVSPSVAVAAVQPSSEELDGGCRVHPRSVLESYRS